jgi:hypothetical protein
MHCEAKLNHSYLRACFEHLSCYSTGAKPTDILTVSGSFDAEPTHYAGPDDGASVDGEPLRKLALIDDVPQLWIRKDLYGQSREKWWEICTPLCKWRLQACSK